MRFSIIFLSVSIGALAGCAPVHYRAKLVDTSGACASDWSQLKAIALSVPTSNQPEALPWEFADHASCLGPPALPLKGEVMLYDLQALGRPAQLEVSLPISAGGTLSGAVDLFDENFKLIQRQGFERFTRRGVAYTLPVFLRDKNPHYLALMPDLSFVGKLVTSIGSLGSTVPITTLYGTFLMAQGHETKAMIPLMAGGQVSVAVVSNYPEPASTQQIPKSKAVEKVSTK